MDRVQAVVDDFRHIQQCVSSGGEGCLYQVLKDMDIADVHRINDVCGALDLHLRQKLPEVLQARASFTSDPTGKVKRLQVFERGITSPGRQAHIHRRKHGNQEELIMRTASSEEGNWEKPEDSPYAVVEEDDAPAAA